LLTVIESSGQIKPKARQIRMTDASMAIPDLEMAVKRGRI
jgi:hypothetical protein